MQYYFYRKINTSPTPDAKYKYDLHNRLVEVEKPGITVKYSYDPLGQRIKSEEVTTKGAKYTKYLMSGMVEQARMELPLPLGEGKGEGGKAMFHTLGLDLAGSLTATGAVGAVLSSTTYNLLLPLGEGKGEGVMSQHYLYDGNGNIISTCNQRGEIIAKLAYSPFGEQLSGPNLPFTFSTKAVDASGLSYYGFRFYSPEVGRWLNNDKLYEIAGTNSYCFCRNIEKYFDISGLYPVSGNTFDEIDLFITQTLGMGFYYFDENSVNYEITNLNVIVEFSEDVLNSQCSGCKIYKTHCSGKIHYTSYKDFIDLPEISQTAYNSLNQKELQAWFDFYIALSIHELGHKAIIVSFLGVDHYIDAFGEDCEGYEYARGKCLFALYDIAHVYNASLLSALDIAQKAYDQSQINPVYTPREYLP